MILKLGIKHQAMELYKVYINHKPGMILIYFTARSALVAYPRSQESVYRTIGPLVLVSSDLEKKNSLVNSVIFSWSIRTFSIGQFGPFPLANSDLSHWSIRTFALCTFHIKTAFRIKKKNHPNI